MSKKKLSALELKLKKLGVLAKSYTDAVAAAGSVNLIEKATANTGYLKTYILAKGVSAESAVTNDNKIGEIDIPKDFLVKSGKLLSVVAGTGDNTGKWMVTAENGTAVTAYEAPTGVTAAGQWIDLTINSQAGDATADHVCINATQLVDIYTAGNGLSLSQGAFSVQLGTNANGLSVSANGLELAVATSSTAGAMSAADKAKLDNLYALLTDAEIASWFGYAANSDMVTTTLPAVSDDSLTDEE